MKCIIIYNAVALEIEFWVNLKHEKSPAQAPCKLRPISTRGKKEFKLLHPLPNQWRAHHTVALQTPRGDHVSFDYAIFAAR